MSGLINHLYLHFYRLWHGAKPRTPWDEMVRLSQSEFLVDRISLLTWIYDWILRSNIQNWAWLNFGNLWEGLYSILFSNFLHGYSDGYIFEDSFRSLFSLVLHEWDSVPDGSLCWSFPIQCVCGASAEGWKWRNDTDGPRRMGIFVKHIYLEVETRHRSNKRGEAVERMAEFHIIPKPKCPKSQDFWD